MPELILLLLGLALLGFWLLARAFLTSTPAQIAQGLRWGSLVAGVLALAALTLSGRLPQLLAAGAALFPVAVRLRHRWRGWSAWRTANGPAAGGSSEVETEWLAMRLDHDTGAMSGTVRQGRFAGRRLDELALPELVGLLRECRLAEEASAQLLEAYLDRCFPDWRAAGDAGPDPGGGRAAAMTRDEAYEVLDLTPGASEAEIRAAHRRLMMKLHPDHGGSTWLAARINLAKDTLLGT
jgi:hypothetical protein